MQIERVQRTGSCCAAHIADENSAIARAKGINDLFPLATLLLQRIEDMMASRTLSETDIQRIVVPLAGIRVRLMTVARPRSASPGPGGEGPLARVLAERCQSIEGRLKELRNDLAAAKGPRLP